MKKALGWAALILLALWVIKNPAAAAADVRQAARALNTLIAAL